MDVVRAYMGQAHAADIYPHHYVCHAKDGNRVTVESEETGRLFEAINFGSNDILGLAGNRFVKQAAIDAIEAFGTSNSSCATLNGRIDLHRSLEREISQFKRLPHTYLFLNAWMAMQAVFDGFCHLAAHIPRFRNTRETLILTDVLNHASINSAVANAGMQSGRLVNQSPDVRVKAFRHTDARDLARKLARYAKPDDRIIVVTDAVFSMDGDIAPLPAIVEVMADYPKSILILDEAHSSGALGETGRGICEHFGLTPDDIRERGIEPIIMTTFSKFAASAGAAISTFSKEFVELLDVCPTSICTISPPPPTTAAAAEAIRQLRSHPELPRRVQDSTRRLRQLLEQFGIHTSGETNIVPILLPDCAPKAYGRFLLEHFGIWVSPVWFIAKPRIRVVVNALHTEEDFERLVDGLISAREHFAPVAIPA